jgi:hypothetical protein
MHVVDIAAFEHRPVKDAMIHHGATASNGSRRSNRRASIVVMTDPPYDAHVHGKARRAKRSRRRQVSATERAHEDEPRRYDSPLPFALAPLDEPPLRLALARRDGRGRLPVRARHAAMGARVLLDRDGERLASRARASRTRVRAHDDLGEGMLDAAIHRRSSRAGLRGDRASRTRAAAKRGTRNARREAWQSTHTRSSSIAAAKNVRHEDDTTPKPDPTDARARRRLHARRASS